MHRTANDSFHPPASGATLELFKPHRTERGSSRPFQSQLHDLNRGAVRAARASPGSKPHSLNSERFGSRRSARRLSHEPHRLFTRLARGGVHDVRRACEACRESGASRRRSANAVKVLANKRQKLTRRGWRGPAAEPPRVAVDGVAIDGCAAEAPRSLAADPLAAPDHRCAWW
jgi:hypothetical protein